MSSLMPAPQGKLRTDEEITDLFEGHNVLQRNVMRRAMT